MIHLTHALPEDNKFFFAYSGGIDSTAALHWLSQGRRFPLGIIHVNHNTGKYADDAMEFVTSIASKYTSNTFVKKIKDPIPPRTSKEAWWRAQRYKLFNEVLEATGKPYPIVLAHNLDDCVEQYIMSTLVRIKRYPLISYYGPTNTIRPFRTWSRDQIKNYVISNKLSWIEDPSNSDTKYTRNMIRKDVVPLIKKLNPGIYNYVKSLIINEDGLIP